MAAERRNRSLLWTERTALYPVCRSASDGTDGESQSVDSSDVVDVAAKIELFERDVIVRAIENLATGAQRLNVGDRGTAKFGPGFRTIEGLGEIVLQFQRTFLRQSRGPRLGIFLGPEAGKGPPHPVGDCHMFSSGCLGFQKLGPRGQHIDRGVDFGSRVRATGG